LLKKFEEESVADQLDLDQDDENPSDLVGRLEGVDLDSTTPDALWAILTSAERSKFITALNNPTGEFAQQLLASEALEKEIQGPWWEALRTDSQVKEDLSPPPRHYAKPRIMEVPVSMINLNSTGRPLVYNICAIFISYAYVTRHLGISPLYSLLHQGPEHSEARRLISRLIPFLTDRKSTKLCPNLTAVSTEIWSAFDLGVMSNALFSLLLRDAAFLLTPIFVTELAGSTSNSETMARSHPHSTSVLALSDLFDVFSIEDGDKAENHITHKINFYAAYIMSTPSVVLRGLVQEMMDEAGYLDDCEGTR